VTRIILVRHGQSQHHVLRLSGGWTDTPLTGLGHHQAGLAANRLREELGTVPVALHTSDLLRASETAAHLAEALAIDARPDARLREYNNGDAANLTHDEAQRRYPEAYKRSLFDSEVPLFPNGESGAEFLARCGAFLDSLDPAGTHVAVTHGGTILGLVAHWLSIPREALARMHFMADPASFTVLTDGRWRTLERLNDTAHLRGTEGSAGLAGYTESG
jgi:probable phosphoglycerate mutase